MNWKRIIGGGLLAGSIVNLGEFGIEPLMGSQMEAFFQRLGLPVPGESAMAALAVSGTSLEVVRLPRSGHLPAIDGRPTIESVDPDYEQAVSAWLAGFLAGMSASSHRAE